MEERLSLGIICHPTFGGSGVVASELGIALADRGHQVHFFSHRRPIRIPASRDNLCFHEVEVTTYPLFKYPPYTLSLATKLAKACHDTRLDILHAHYAIPHAVSAYLCRQMLGDEAPKVVTTLHGTDITLVGLDESFYDITRFSILQSDGVTAVSKDLARQTRHDFEVEREVEVIPNFVETDIFTPRLRDPRSRARYIAEGECLVGHLSNFREVKRVLDVVRIFHRAQRVVPSRLLLIGDGPEREPARTLVGDLGLRERVDFLGLHDAVPEILPQLDVFLLPSEYESFGLAALEAMACGVPVVATRAGGLPEVVVDGETGYLRDVGDLDGMAACVERILGEPGRRDSMGQAARRRAEEVFPEDRIVDQYEAMYRRVLASGR